MMKRLRVFLIVALIITAAVIAFYFLGGPLFNINFGFARERITAESTVLFMEARAILNLNTVEVVHKSIFPDDFFSPGTDLEKMRQTDDSGGLASADPQDVAVYRLCEEIGIRRDRKHYDFVVITSIVKAGFDFSPAIQTQDPADEVSDKSAGVIQNLWVDDSRMIHLRLPPPVITDFIIQDSNTGDYGYPDIALQPEQWKQLVLYVETRIREQVAEEGLLLRASENGKQFLRRYLSEAGYSGVTFIE